MTKKIDFGYLAVIAILIGVYSIIYNQYVYKYEKYYLGENLITKNITVKKIPEYFKGNLIRPTHYTFTSSEFKNRFWVSDGALEQLYKDKTEEQISTLKVHDSLTIKVRSLDEINLQDSTSKVRIIDLSKNGIQLINSGEVEKYDRKSYNFNLGFAITILIFGIVWQVIRAQKKKRTVARLL